jgi:hypothetical protein
VDKDTRRGLSITLIPLILFYSFMNVATSSDLDGVLPHLEDINPLFFVHGVVFFDSTPRKAKTNSLTSSCDYHF